MGGRFFLNEEPLLIKEQMKQTNTDGSSNTDCLSTLTALPVEGWGVPLASNFTQRTYFLFNPMIV